MLGETLSICLLLIRGRHENRIASNYIIKKTLDENKIDELTQQRHKEYQVLNFNGFRMLVRTLNKLLRIPIKKSRQSSYLMEDRSEEIVRPVPIPLDRPPRNHKSSCVLCWNIGYSYNSDKTFLCYDCSRLVCFRDVLSFLVDKRRYKKFKDTVLVLRKHLESRPIDGVFGGKQNEWANVIMYFFKTMPWDVKNIMISYI